MSTFLYTLLIQYSIITWLLINGIFGDEIGEINCTDGGNCTCILDKKLISAHCTSFPKSLVPQVKIFNLHGNFPVINKFDTAPLTKVDIVDLSKCGIQGVEEAFSKVNRFKVIRLSQNRIKAVKEQHFSALLMLKELYLNENLIETIEEHSFEKLKSLTILQLQDNKLKLITFLSHVPSSLSILNLFGNVINEIPDNVMTNLTYLNVCGNEVGKVVGLSREKRLQELCLSGVRYMSQRALPSGVTNLSLAAPQLGPQTLLTDQMESNISPMSNLSHLALVNYKIDSFHFLHNLNTLSYLKLEGVRVTNTSIAELFKNSVNLLHLNLDQSPQLAKQLLTSYKKIPNIKSLSIKKNGITSLENYESIRYLKMIDIRGNPLNCTKENWRWIKGTFIDLAKYFIQVEELECKYPPNVEGMKLIKILNEKLFAIPTQSSLMGEDKEENYYNEIVGPLIYAGVIGVAFIIIAATVYKIISKKNDKSNEFNDNYSIELNHEITNELYSSVRQQDK